MDEAVSGNVIRSLIEAFSKDINVCVTCDTVANAILAIDLYKPGLILMDAELADGSTFQVLEHFPELDAYVIFVSADEKYALKALKYHAFDYVLKPIVADELYDVLANVLRHIQKASAHARIDILQHYLQHSQVKKIAIPDHNGLQYHAIDDIIMIEGRGSYSKIFLSGDRALVVSKLIKDFETSLISRGFLRVHKSYLVNTAYVTALKKDDSNYLVMSNGIKVPISIKTRDKVLSSLKMYSAFV